MEHGVDAVMNGAGWIVSDTNAWWFVGAWCVIVLLYALWRSRGDAEPDPLRDSGPIP